MTAPLATQAASQLLTISSCPPWLTKALGAMICDGLKVTLPAALALSTEQHRDVRQRMVWCEQALQPANAGEIGAEVAGLLIAFPSAQISETTARIRARAYHTALEGIPAWALAAAAKKWLQGEGEGSNLDFAPSPPRLRKMAEQEVNAVRGHLVNLRRLATAEVERDIPEDERARVAARFEALRSGVAGEGRKVNDAA